MAVCPWQLLLTLSSWSISYSWQHARLSSLYLLLLKLWCNYFGETMDVLCYSGSQSLAYDLFTTKLQSCATGCMSRAGKRSTKKAEKNSQLIVWSIDWKLTGNYFDDWLIIWIIFQAKMLNIHWFQFIILNRISFFWEKTKNWSHLGPKNLCRLNK